LIQPVIQNWITFEKLGPGVPVVGQIWANCVSVWVTQKKISHKGFAVEEMDTIFILRECLGKYSFKKSYHKHLTVLHSTSSRPKLSFCCDDKTILYL